MKAALFHAAGLLAGVVVGIQLAVLYGQPDYEAHPAKALAAFVLYVGFTIRGRSA